MKNEWIDMIAKLYTRLHTSDRVMHTSKESDKKRARIIKYFERLERVHDKVRISKSPAAEIMLRNFYYDLYVIKKENIPESYYLKEQKKLRERGYGDIELTEKKKDELAETVISNQKKSLDYWIKYFLYDEESKSYEMWEKYWVFQGLQKLGKYDKEKGKFSKRDKTTVYPFPHVDREAVFTTLKLMEDYLKEKKSEPEIRSALASGNFKALYEYSLKMILKLNNKKISSTEGKWVKYDQGSDYQILRNDLQDHYTGWCTAAGENFAKDQIAGGDFYVYFSLDENGEAKVPRIAIRMKGSDEIEEIRGAIYHQNMEPEMMPILNEKLKEFPDRDKYFKKEHDMKMITNLDYKNNNGEPFSLEELRFLYEIDEEIEGFGYRKDPRVEEIKSKRNNRKDLSLIYGCKEDEVALSVDEFLLTKDPMSNKNKKFVVFYGDLDLFNLTSLENINLPDVVMGKLNLSGIKYNENLIMPKEVRGHLFLISLKETEGLVLPEKVEGGLYLNSLKNIKDLIFPKIVGGGVYLDDLLTAENIKFSEILKGGLYLDNLKKATNIEFPMQVTGDLYAGNLKELTTSKLPKQVGGDFVLGVTSPDGLILPEKIGGSLYLYHLKSLKGVKIPKDIIELDLDSLETLDGFSLPKGFDLDKLTIHPDILEEIRKNPTKYFENKNGLRKDVNINTMVGTVEDLNMECEIEKGRVK